MEPFKRRKRGGIYAKLEPAEAQMIVNLLGQVVELLRDRNGEDESSPDPLFAQIGMGGSHLPPEDPVLKRLLPDGYTDDEEGSADFRRFTERTLSSAKVHNAEIVIASLAQGGLDLDRADDSADEIEIELDDEQVQAWLRSLTDVRLSLGVRLGIESDEDVEAVSRSEDEATSAMSDIYDWLGFVQESLVFALD